MHQRVADQPAGHRAHVQAECAVPAGGVRDRIAAPLPGPAGGLHAHVLPGQVAERLVRPDGQHRQVTGAALVPDHLGQPPRRRVLRVGVRGVQHRLPHQGQHRVPRRGHLVRPGRAGELADRGRHCRHEFRVVPGGDTEPAVVAAELAQICGQLVRGIQAPDDPGQGPEKTVPLPVHGQREKRAHLWIGSEQAAVEICCRLTRGRLYAGEGFLHQSRIGRCPSMRLSLPACHIWSLAPQDRDHNRFSAGRSLRCSIR